MRILITGSRKWTDISLIWSAMRRQSEKRPEDEVIVVHGEAQDADSIAAYWAERDGWQTEEHLADWQAFGKSAGFIRNSEMVKAGADVCLAFIKNESKGATMCADLAEKAGIPTIRFVE